MPARLGNEATEAQQRGLAQGLQILPGMRAGAIGNVAHGHDDGHARGHRLFDEIAAVIAVLARLFAQQQNPGRRPADRIGLHGAPVAGNPDHNEGGNRAAQPVADKGGIELKHHRPPIPRRSLNQMPVTSSIVAPSASEIPR